MSVLTDLRSRRQDVEARLAREGRLHTLSLSRYRLHEATTEALRLYGYGDVLEAGAGLSPYASTLDEVADKVTTLDVEDRSGSIDLIGDIQAMPEIADGSMDTVLCTQVLEHVPDPGRAIQEIARVLKPGGRLVATVPHLSMIHEAPHDYFRFTEFGLTHLCDEADLVVERLKPTGGLVSFLGHTLSGGLLASLGAVPVVGGPVRMLNYVLFVRAADPIDRLLGFPHLFPRDYLLVARKPEKPGDWASH